MPGLHKFIFDTGRLVPSMRRKQIEPDSPNPLMNQCGPSLWPRLSFTHEFGGSSVTTIPTILQSTFTGKARSNAIGTQNSPTLVYRSKGLRLPKLQIPEQAPVIHVAIADG